MRALSIRQPWAWCIANGSKDVENRTWGTSYRGLILIHAGKMFDGDSYEYLRERSVEMPLLRQLDTGGIVGVAELIACVELAHTRMKSDWAFGPFCWILAHRRSLPFHPVRGQLGLFDVNYELSNA